MNQWPHQNAVSVFYGNPDPDGDGVPNPSWEAAHLVTITPPYRMVLAWDVSRRLKSIRVHRKCAGSLMQVLTNIAHYFGSEQNIEENRMHLYGGCYNFRLMRGSTKLSMHSYGCAIDLDPAGNPLGRFYREKAGMIPRKVVELFKAEGWEWGGDWHRPDCQHFQAAVV